MEKIHWGLEKDKFSPEIKSVLICQGCGWLVANPRIPVGERDRGVDDRDECSNCGVKITNSVQVIKKLKEKK